MALLGINPVVAHALDSFHRPGLSPGSAASARMARRAQLAKPGNASLRHLDAAGAGVLQLVQPPGILRDRGNPRPGTAPRRMVGQRDSFAAGERGTPRGKNRV